MNRSSFIVPLSAALPFALLAVGGCDQKTAAPSTPAPAAHSHDDGHDHGPNGEHVDKGQGHGGPVIALGEQTLGQFTTSATRDEGVVVAGKDAAFDITITPAPSATVKVSVVRIWIGTEDAKGSVKAKAEVEDAKKPNIWHTHAEVPNPIPQGSKLWVEVEDDKGAKSVGSFDLKA